MQTFPATYEKQCRQQFQRGSIHNYLNVRIFIAHVTIALLYMPVIKNSIKRIILALFIVSGIASQNICSAQLIARLTIPEIHGKISAPVCIDIDNLTSLSDSMLSLVEVRGGKKIPVPFQVEHGYHRFLWWMAAGNQSFPNQALVFELSKNTKPKQQTGVLSAVKKDGALLLSDNGKPLLQYNFKEVYPPKGIDTVYKRSGFIHPLWSPEGNILTRINPPDHYHHVGIWNPWTKVLFEGKVVDFWNLNKKEGTVRFSKFIGKEEGPVYAGFKALQEHVVLNDPAGEKTALNEVWDIRAYPLSNNFWICDFTSILNCATASPVLLEEYRYGGFGFRATEAWNDNNSKILTSEGKTRKDADASNARWCMIDGDIKNGHSGILFMSFPANFNYPEPMRVWPEKMNGRGDVFFSFSPTRNTDWSLVPNKSYVLKYRMLMYEGTITPEQAEEAWQSFANPVKVIVTPAHSNEAKRKK